ncbi:unnamed protein product [Linum trigynum]|uniref:Uncharacterized protein n=1 Tax=Linum trigynum TaxID=586398 RepID=A0AAV2CKK3_9ROSI
MPGRRSSWQKKQMIQAIEQQIAAKWLEHRVKSEEIKDEYAAKFNELWLKSEGDPRVDHQHMSILERLPQEGADLLREVKARLDALNDAIGGELNELWKLKYAIQFQKAPEPDPAAAAAAAYVTNNLSRLTI